MKHLTDLFTIAVIAGGSIFAVAWMTLFPAIGFLWCMGVLK